MFNYKVPFVATLLSASHTGADVSRGFVKEHRTEKQIIKTPYEIRSKFKRKQDKQECIALLLYRIYELIEDKARMSIHDEFSDAVAIAAKWQTKGEFIEILTRKMEISLNKIRYDGRLTVLDLLNAFEDDADLLQEIRDEHQYLMIRFKMIWQEFKKHNDAMVEYHKVLKDMEGKPSLPGLSEPVVAPTKDYIDNLEIKLLVYCNTETEAVYEPRTINYANIPLYTGNGIKGIMRRLLMEDFCELSGLSKKQLSSTAYHRLFTGGVISKASGDERIDRKREMIGLCPPLGLLGSAVEDGTISGAISVSDLQLQCKERDSEHPNSFTELVVPRFLTRLDSSKTETLIDIAQVKNNEVETHQMKYLTEVMIAGAKLDGQLSVLTHSEIILSCFARAINLMKNHAHIGGKGTVGFGTVEFEGLEAPEGVTETAYMEYVIEKAPEILAYGW